MNLFLSVGAMKAGTTWLYSLLEKHPDLYFTPEKEIHFLNNHYVNKNILRDEYRLNQAKNRLVASSTNHIGVYKMLSRWYAMYLEKPSDHIWYERLFSLNKQKKYNCDFSNLSCHLDVNHWEDVRSRYDNIRLIYVLRDPMGRLWSHIKFHHQFAGRNDEYLNWNETDFKFFLNKKFISENTTYGKYIKNMKKVFSPEEFKVFYFENFNKSPESELFKLEEFLGISHFSYDNNSLYKKVNASKNVVMPQSFINASKSILEFEFKDLIESGEKIHKDWQV